MKKMTVMDLTADNVINGITKISPKDGDVLLFHIKTDQNGFPLCDLETVQETANMVSSLLEDRNVKCLFLFDKICLFSVENAERAIKSLKKSIFYIQEAIGKIEDIENGISEESFLTF